MRYMASIYVSDVLDLVAATVELQGWTGQWGPPEIVYEKTFQFPGIGADVPHEWLARALFLMAEEMTKPVPKGWDGPGAMGGPHTISGSGDTRI